MAAKRSVTIYVGLALLIIGSIQFLSAIGLIHITSIWTLPVILVLVGILVAVNGRPRVQWLGWIGLAYGLAMVLMNLGLFHSSILWKISPLTWILFGLILIL